MKLLPFFLAFATTALAFYVLIVGKNLLIPLVLALFIWYLINILTETVQKLPKVGQWLPRGAAFAVAILAILGALGLFVTLVSNNVAQIVEVAPIYQQNLERLAARVYASLGIAEPPTLAKLSEKIDFAMILSRVAAALGGLIGNAGLIAGYLIFLFVEQQFFEPKLRALVPELERRNRVVRLIEQIEADVRTYVGLKTLSSLASAVLGYAAMAWVGLDFAAFWAIMIFILHFIPNIGFLLSTALPALLALVQFDTLQPFLIVLIGVAGSQLVIANFLEPKLMGHSLNLSPLVLILSLVLWGTLWGISGMFLCVPIMVVAMIILAHFPQTRPLAILLSVDGRIRAHEG